MIFGFGIWDWGCRLDLVFFYLNIFMDGFLGFDWDYLLEGRLWMLKVWVLVGNDRIEFWFDYEYDYSLVGTMGFRLV